MIDGLGLRINKQKNQQSSGITLKIEKVATRLGNITVIKSFSIKDEKGLIHGFRSSN